MIVAERALANDGEITRLSLLQARCLFSVDDYYRMAEAGLIGADGARSFGMA